MPGNNLADDYSGFLGTSLDTDTDAAKQISFAVPRLNLQTERRGYCLAKRLMDITLCALAFAALMPLFAIVILAIRADSEGAALYKQKRVGKNGKTFIMYKFRSMCKDAERQFKNLEHLNEVEGPAFKIRNDPRVTRVGAFIRRTCIDELPQLVNIIKGDMSIVGPRPPLPDEVRRYSLHQRQRLRVKPGLTCYWQVSGQKDISFDSWVEMDLRYIREQNLWIDTRVIFKTLHVALSGKGNH